MDIEKRLLITDKEIITLYEKIILIQGDILQLSRQQLEIDILKIKCKDLEERLNSIK